MNDSDTHTPPKDRIQSDDLLSWALTCCHGLVEQLTQVDLRQTLGPDLRDRILTTAEPPSGDYRRELAALTTRVAPSGAQSIDPTWFVSFGTSAPGPGSSSGTPDSPGPPTPLPERVVELLPIQIRDQVALLLGGTVRAAGRLPGQAAVEVAKRLWATLAPMPTTARGDAISDLPLRTGDALERSIRKLGARLMGLMLSAVPDRAAAALCQKLPPEEARDVWIHRREACADRPSLGSLKEGARRLAEAAPAQTVLRLGSLVLATALEGPHDLARQVAQRLPRSVGRMVLDATRTERGGDPSPRLNGAVVDQCEATRWLADVLE